MALTAQQREVRPTVADASSESATHAFFSKALGEVTDYFKANGLREITEVAGSVAVGFALSRFTYGARLGTLLMRSSMVAGAASPFVSWMAANEGGSGWQTAANVVGDLA